MAVRVISESWTQKRLIPTFQTWCTLTSWKILRSPIRASWWLLESFRPPEPKNVWFLLSRHDVRRVHEKFSSRPFELANGCLTHFGFLSPKTFDSYFSNMMYVEFMKNFLLADSSELMAVRLISASADQKRLIFAFSTWCTSRSWNIFFSPIRASYWLFVLIHFGLKYFEQHVLRVGIKCFWAHQFEISLTSVNLSQTTRLKFFMNTTHAMSGKFE